MPLQSSIKVTLEHMSALCCPIRHVHAHKPCTASAALSCCRAQQQPLAALPVAAAWLAAAAQSCHTSRCPWGAMLALPAAGHALAPQTSPAAQLAPQRHEQAAASSSSSSRSGGWHPSGSSMADCIVSNDASTTSVSEWALSACGRRKAAKLLLCNSIESCGSGEWQQALSPACSVPPAPP